MASVTGSRLAFFSDTVTADKVNVVLTTDGSDVAGKSIAGDFNIEVFTSTAGSLASGYQASAFIQGAQPLTNNAIQAGTIGSTEQLLAGSYTMIDMTGGESIQIVGSGSSSDVVVGSSGDTITGSGFAGDSQYIDASGTNASANPGPFQGPETVTGGAGRTTVLGGKGDIITGGAGFMQVNDGTLAGAETVVGAAGALKVFSIGKNFSITGSTGGNTYIDDTYGSGGNSRITGGSGTGAPGGFGENTFIKGTTGDLITGGTNLTYIDASKGGQTVVGGSGTVTGTIAGFGGINTNIVGGSGDTITAGAGNTYIDAKSFTGAETITGGAGALNLLAGANDVILGGTGTATSTFGGLFTANTGILGAAGDTITGRAGSMFVNAIAGSESITGGSGGTTVLGGPGDSIVGGSGTLRVDITAKLSGSEQITVGSGAAVLRDVSDATATGAAASTTVTGFNAAIDSIASATSVLPGGGTAPSALVGASANLINGTDTLITFSDGSTMTVLNTTPGSIKFIQ